MAADLHPAAAANLSASRDWRPDGKCPAADGALTEEAEGAVEVDDAGARNRGDRTSPETDDNAFDVAILGTGVVESICAGAFACAGKRVLHLDGNAYYGGTWSAFTTKGWLEWAVDCAKGDLLRQLCPLNEPKAFKASHVSNFTDFAFPTGGAWSLQVLPETTRSALAHLIDGHGYTGTAFSAAEEEIGRALRQRPNASTFDQLSQPSPHEEDVLRLQATLLSIQLFTEPRPLAEAAPAASMSPMLLCEPAVSRHFNIDICPKLVRCCGPMIDALISSKVGNYMEFKGVAATYMCADGGGDVDGQGAVFLKVPASKEDVFASKTVSLVEKRRIVKFLKFVQGLKVEPDGSIVEGVDESMNIPFREYLDYIFQIRGTLQKYLLYGIARMDALTAAEEASTVVGLRRMHEYQKAAGRFGRGTSAFLCPLYGTSSEVAQSFCRLCSVFGGTYMLNCDIGSVVRMQETGLWHIRCKHGGKIAEEDGTPDMTFTAEKMLCSPDYAGVFEEKCLDAMEWDTSYVSRGLLITDVPVHGEEEACETVFPPGSRGGNAGHTIWALHVGHRTQNCPLGMHMTYLFSKSVRTPYEDLSRAALLLLESDAGLACTEANAEPSPDATEETSPTEAPPTSLPQRRKPTILFSAYFRQRIRMPCPVEYGQDGTCSRTFAADADLATDFDGAAEEARRIFERMYPEEGFLTREEDGDGEED